MCSCFALHGSSAMCRVMLPDITLNHLHTPNQRKTNLTTPFIQHKIANNAARCNRTPQINSSRPSVPLKRTSNPSSAHQTHTYPTSKRPLPLRSTPFLRTLSHPTHHHQITPAARLRSLYSSKLPTPPSPPCPPSPRSRSLLFSHSSSSAAMRAWNLCCWPRAR